MSTFANIISQQSQVLHELELLRSAINTRLTAILASGDTQGAHEAAIVAKWLDDGTIPARHLVSRADGINRYLGGRRHD